mgnify:CR=1 FL=1
MEPERISQKNSHMFLKKPRAKNNKNDGKTPNIKLKFRMKKPEKKVSNSWKKRLKITKATLVQYVTNHNLKLNENTVGRFTYNWIRTRGKNKDFKPYKVKLMIVDIITVMDTTMRPITISMKRAIKMAASKASGMVFKNQLQQPKRATPYTPREMKPVITKLKILQIAIMMVF